MDQFWVLTNLAIAVVQSNRWSEWFWQPLRLNWPLVLVGIGAIWAALRTLDAIKRQADIMAGQTKDTAIAAQAAKASADALIASERAWVMVDLEKVPGQGAIIDGTRGDGSHYTSASVRCICSNQGKTPAQIVEKRICLFITMIGKALPQEPNLDIEIIDPVPDYLQSRDESTHDWAFSSDGAIGIGNMGVIYGVVKYRPIFSDREGQTTFGYRVTDDYKLERLTGYPKYNENT
jgi:hypothetical protein